jgi:hypothetical protein
MALACFWLYDTVHSGQSSLDPLRTPAGNGASKYCSHRDVSRKCRAFQFRRPPLNQFLCPSGPPPFFSQRLSKTTGKPHTTAPSPRITFCHALEHAGIAQKCEHDDGEATFSYCSSSLTKPGFGFISPLLLRTYLQAGQCAVRERCEQSHYSVACAAPNCLVAMMYAITIAAPLQKHSVNAWRERGAGEERRPTP